MQQTEELHNIDQYLEFLDSLNEIFEISNENLNEINQIV